MISFKKYIPALICLILLVGAIFVSNNHSGEQNEKLALQAATISDLNHQVAMKNPTTSESQKEEASETGNLNNDRATKDKEVSNSFLEQVLTWKTFEEYTNIRNLLLQAYKVKERDEFLHDFMPEIEASMFTTQNLKFEQADIYVTDISGSNYTYFAIATVSSTDTKGNNATGNVGLIYTIDSEGNVFDISAYALTR